MPGRTALGPAGSPAFARQLIPGCHVPTALQAQTPTWDHAVLSETLFILIKHFAEWARLLGDLLTTWAGGLCVAGLLPASGRLRAVGASASCTCSCCSSWLFKASPLPPSHPVPVRCSAGVPGCPSCFSADNLGLPC